MKDTGNITLRLLGAFRGHDPRAEHCCQGNNK